MSELARLSAALDVSERTMRRASDSGLVRADRLSKRRLRIPDAERRYLTSHWSLLSGLRAALRTEPNVRLAILFGSTARGDDRSDSDVDVLVQLRSASRFRMLELEDRLSQAIGRAVELTRFSDAERDRTLLSEVIADGRVLVDRDDVWPRLAADRQAVGERAEREFASQVSAALKRARSAVSG